MTDEEYKAITGAFRNAFEDCASNADAVVAVAQVATLIAIDLQGLSTSSGPIFEGIGKFLRDCGITEKPADGVMQ